VEKCKEFDLEVLRGRLLKTIGRERVEAPNARIWLQGREGDTK
jgi:hypothetical protein